MFRYLPAVLVGRLARVLIRLFRKGGGSAAPGLILSRLAPGILKSTLKKFPQGLSIITGSAGKSTTTKMVVAIIRAHGVSVFTNPSTANILQGFYSTIIEKSNWAGKISADIAVLEMDEAHAEELTRRLSPEFVTVLNVMEDQLDRFVDPSLVRDDLTRVAERATKAVVLNADDENIRLLANSAKRLEGPSWFGITAPVIAQQRHGLATAPTYTEPSPRPKVSSEVLKLEERKIELEWNGEQFRFELPNRGLHFALDAVAAFETAARILGSDFSPQLAAQIINDLPPVFARGELVEVRGKKAEFILVQNPGSMQLNLDNLNSNPDQILFAIGRDVHDPSWMWTVDLSQLTHATVVTGFNAAEAALLLEFHGIPVGEVIYDLEDAIDAFFSLPEPKSGVKTVIFSADVMRRMRRALGFWSPEEVQR